MTYTGNENHDISLDAAAQMTKNFRDTVSTTATIALYFGKKAIQDILNQENCVGLRLYYAINENSQNQLVAVGVDSSGNDLYQGKLADRALCCPNYCSSANPLNSNMTPNTTA